VLCCSNLSKIWQIPKCCGKNSGRAFFDVFKAPETKSGAILSQKNLVQAVQGFVDFGCPQLHKGRCFVPENFDIWRRVVEMHHDALPMGYPGQWQTLELV